MVVPFSSKRGSTPSPVVCTFAPFSAATTAPAAASFFASAAFAVSARAVTVKENVARSGTVSTEPAPVTVIVFVVVGAGAAERANCGCATPATAAAAKSTRTAMEIFMPDIRRRGRRLSRGMEDGRGELVASAGGDALALGVHELVRRVGEVDGRELVRRRCMQCRAKADRGAVRLELVCDDAFDRRELAFVVPAAHQLLEV